MKKKVQNFKTLKIQNSYFKQIQQVKNTSAPFSNKNLNQNLNNIIQILKKFQILINTQIQNPYYSNSKSFSKSI